MDCIFCKIIAGEIPSTKVYEDEHTLGFLSISPNNQGHTLVIPKQHYRNIFDIEEETLKNLALTVKKVSQAVFTATNAEGVNIIMNNEAPAGQAVFHAHIHIIPRYTDDGLKNWDKQVTYSEGEGGKIADAIISNF